MSGLSPWSGTFYGVEPARDEIQHSGVKGMKWKQHLKSTATELVGDVKKAGKAVGNEAVAIKDKGIAALNNAHTKKVQPEVDKIINDVLRSTQSDLGYAKSTYKTYKDILYAVEQAPGADKLKPSDRANAAAQIAKKLISNSATSVNDQKNEQLQSRPVPGKKKKH